ncbi:MAG: S46 family peptidase [Candidatus Aminicenantes bacterium]|nr:S46 family peptidase [Candidatus Aminicenantes bacterium]
MKYLKYLFSLTLSVLLINFSFADDGMWMPHQMKNLDLKAFGLKMDPADLYKKDGTGLMSAVVHLGGGTGEFVSKEGLILTNHHVAFGALQRASDKEHDYIQNGFIAWEKSQEIPAYGYIADVLLGYEEVTDLILSKIKTDIPPLEKYYAIEKSIKELVAKTEEQGPDIRASVASMYSGNQYFLFRFKRLRDIRLVYAPPRDLGNFGGDIDNWMWPRHTCDFSFLRAYISPQNEGIAYHADNIPYKPKSVMKISLEGFKNGDFSFVMGYPGRTYRNYTLAELKFDLDNMQESISTRQDMISFLEKAGQGNREVEIKYAGTIKGLNNGLKNYLGKLEGMQKAGILDKKEKQEQEFLAWVAQSPKHKQKYGDILDKIENFMEKYQKFSKKNDVLNQLGGRYSSALLSQANTIIRTAQERQKPDLERETQFQERNLPYIKQRIELAERSYDLNTDRALLKHNLKKMQDIPANQLPLALKDLLTQKSEQDINDYVDKLYSETILASVEKRLELIEMTPDEVLATRDPFIFLAAQLEEEIKELREESKALNQERADLKKIYLEALLEMNEGRIAPDANSTIRFTYGVIDGYSPRDAVYYESQTTLTGVIEKETREFPFHVPEKLKQLYASRDFGPYLDKNLQDIPACFLNTTNVTGGNSGSPTLNAKGEQTGIIFDMTYESVTGDYYVIPELQRTISVDIRYVLFVTEKFSEAAHVIKELQLR